MLGRAALPMGCDTTTGGGSYMPLNGANQKINTY